MYVIYKVVIIINSKSYIGFDSNWPQRHKEHLYEAYNEGQKQFHYAFSRAIRKYGENNFIWEPIYTSKDKEYTLKVMEPHFIQQYDSYQNGYNMTLGGEGTFGIFFSEERRQIQSQKIKKWLSIPQNNPMYGRSKSIHFMEIKTKPFKIISPTNEIFFIKNLNDFCRLYGLDQGAMTKVAQGKRKHHKNWICQYG